MGQLPDGDERAQAVCRNRPLIFDLVTALDVLLLPFLKQVGPRGHTNSHGRPHFSTVCDRVEVRVGRDVELGHNSGARALDRWKIRLRCLWLAPLPWKEPFPTDRKSAAGLSPAIELKNEFTGDIERDRQEN